MANTIGVHHRAVLCLAADFLPGRAVRRICRIRKMDRVQHMVVTVDFVFVENAHQSLAVTSWLIVVKRACT
jgi:hypothetical protein